MGKAKVDRSTSAKDAAEKLGVSRATLSKWVNERKAPCRWEGKRYFLDVAELSVWRDRNGLGDHGGNRVRGGTASEGSGEAGGLASQLQLADLRKKLASAEKAELELAELRGELLRREEVEIAQQTRCAYAKAVLMGGPTGLAPDIASDARKASSKAAAVERVEATLRDWRDRVLKELASG